MAQSLERATVFEGSQVGVETTPGTAVSANKRLLCTSIQNLSPNIPTTNYRTFGSKASTSVIAGKGLGAAQVEGAICPTDLTFLMNTVCTGVITTPGGGSLTRNHLFKPLNSSADSFKTLTIDSGSFAGGSRSTYGVINGFEFDININEPIARFTANMVTQTPDNTDVWRTGYEVYTIVKDGTVTGGTFTLTPNGGSATGNINWDDTAAEIQAILEANAAVGVGNVQCYGGPLPSTAVTVVYGGSLFGTNPTDTTIDDTNITGGGDMILTKVQDGATITDLEAIPIPSSEWDIYVSTTYAGLPTTWTTGNDADSLLRCTSFKYTLPENRMPGFFLDTSEESFSALVEKDVEGAQVTLSHMANAEGRAFLPYLTAGTRLFVRAIGTHPTAIEGSLYPGVQITAAIEVSDYKEADNSGMYDSQIVATNVYDGDLGGFVEIQLRNELTAVS